MGEAASPGRLSGAGTADPERNQLQTRAQGLTSSGGPIPGGREQGKRGARTRSTQHPPTRTLSLLLARAPHHPRPRLCRRLGRGDPPRAQHPRAHRHLSAAILFATPAATSFRAKSGSRDPLEPGKRLKEHVGMTSASTSVMPASGRRARGGGRAHDARRLRPDAKATGPGPWKPRHLPGGAR